MLDIITKSKTRKNILRLFFYSENKEFYLSEIAGFINASVGNTQRELNKLQESGIIATVKKGNMRYYFFNQKNPLLKELKNIIRKTIGIENELKIIVNNIAKIEFAFIFGSYAKGGFSDESDIDLAIIGLPDENLLIEKISKLEKLINREINYHIYAKKDFKLKYKKETFLKNIIKNYILLTDNEDEFRKLFQ